jgi:RNA polymerase sigma-70 factor, ECF subfamily
MVTEGSPLWQQQIRAQYDQFGPALRRRCERVLQNTQDAQDVVQELFMDIWNKKRGDFDFSYLYAAATNRCITLLRKQNRHRDLLKQHDFSPVSSTLLPDDCAYSLQCLQALVMCLDKTSSAIFLYRYIDDMTQEEIGEVMGLSRKTVGKKLTRLENRLSSLSQFQDHLPSAKKGASHVR